MTRKLFPSDKNYLLKQIQDENEQYLLTYLVEYVKEFYQLYYNPLGLEDSAIKRIRATTHYKLDYLRPFYNLLSGIYRFKYGEVQLTFLFDGASHEEKYETEWVWFFKSSIEKYCYQEHFIKSVLEVTVFRPDDRMATLAGNRMKYFLEHYFDLKLYVYKGIQEAKAS